MKIRHYFLIALGLFLCHGAYAEEVTGTITDVDSTNSRVSLKDSNTGLTTVVSVNDKNSFSMLQTGNQVTFDASKTASGDWQSRSVRVNGGPALDPSSRFSPSPSSISSPSPTATLAASVGIGSPLRSALPATSSGIFGSHTAASTKANATEGSLSVNSNSSVSAEKK